MSRSEASLIDRLRHKFSVRLGKTIHTAIYSLFEGKTRNEHPDSVTVELTQEHKDVRREISKRTPPDLNGDQDCACE